MLSASDISSLFGFPILLAISNRLISNSLFFCFSSISICLTSFAASISIHLVSFAPSVALSSCIVSSLHLTNSSSKSSDFLISSTKLVTFSLGGSFHVNSIRPLNPPSGILTKLGVYITPTVVRNYAKYFFLKPHSLVYRRDENFKISPLLTIS